MTIQELADLILIQSREVLRAKGYDSQVDGERVEVRPGPKYTKIDRGPAHNMSGFLMVVNTTSAIYGIKGYGVPNRKKQYGTLATAGQWFWGEYTPRPLADGQEK
jgi:hypothetical protein